MAIPCPACGEDIGGPSPDGGLRVRLAITLIDPETGRVHGPCPHCRGDVTVAEDAKIPDVIKAVEPAPRRRRMVLALPRTG